MVTNGEHNGLRMQGNTRPLHILQIRAEARSKIGRKSAKVLLAMLTPKGKMCTVIMYGITYSFHHAIVNTDGSISAKCPDRAVSHSILKEIFEWKRSGVSMDDIVDRLRSRTVPSGNPIHPWILGLLTY